MDVADIFLIFWGVGKGRRRPGRGSVLLEISLVSEEEVFLAHPFSFCFSFWPCPPHLFPANVLLDLRTSLLSGGKATCRGWAFGGVWRGSPRRGKRNSLRKWRAQKGEAPGGGDHSRFSEWSIFSIKTKGLGEQGAAGYCPKILLLQRTKMVLCPFHRSHREICTRNWPVFRDEISGWFLGAPFSPGPFLLLLISAGV